MTCEPRYPTLRRRCDRMSRTRLGYQFAAIPEWILYHPDLTPIAVRVYGALARCGMTPDECFPSHAWIGNKIGLAERSVARPMAQLEAVGAIRAIHRGSATGGRTSDGYWLAGDAPLTAQESADTSEGYRADPRDLSAQDSAVRTAHDRAPIENQGDRDPDDRENTLGANAPLFLVQEIDPSPPPDLFDAFWKAYPRKRGKKDAVKAWATAIGKVDQETIVRAAERYAADPNLPPLTYVPHPATWLNKELWTDPPLESRTGAPSPNAGIDTDRGGPTGLVDWRTS